MLDYVMEDVVFCEEHGTQFIAGEECQICEQERRQADEHRDAFCCAADFSFPEQDGK